jgi:hypothetical protein
MRPFIAIACLTTLAMGVTFATASSQTDKKGAAEAHKQPPAGKIPQPITKKGDTKPHYVVSAGSATFNAVNTKLNLTIKNKQPPHVQYAKQMKAAIDSGNLKVTPAQQGALDKLLSQQPLTPDDRQQLSNLLFQGSQAGLTSEDEIALSYLLTDDLARGDGAPAAPTSPAAGPLSVRVVNKTTDRIKVWVQVVQRDATAADDKAKTETLPTLKYEMDGGKAYDLLTKNQQKLEAKVIRIWAISPTQQWASNRDHDLALTPSGSSKIFVVTFAANTAATSP